MRQASFVEGRGVVPNRPAGRITAFLVACLIMSVLLGIFGMLAEPKCSCASCQLVKSPLQAGSAAAGGADSTVRRSLRQEQHDARPAQDEALTTGSKPHEEPPAGLDDAYVAMCTAVKDEHCDIREWVLHHATLGVGKFYVFDTQSAERMEPVLEDLISSGLVAYQYVTNTSGEVALRQPGPGRSYNWQVPIFTLCLQRYGQRHRWMGFIDADEFVVPTSGSSDDGSGTEESSNSDGMTDDSLANGNDSGEGGHAVDRGTEATPGSSSSNSNSSSSEGSQPVGSRHLASTDSGSNLSSDTNSGSSSQKGPLSDLLRRHEAHAGLVLHWQLFAFNGHIDRPSGGVLTSYTSCWPQDNGIHRHVKSFVQPALVIRPETPHSFFYSGNQSAVNTAGERVKGPIVRKGQVTYRGAVLHHYISKSLADFEVKQQRRGGAGSVKSLTHFLKWHRRSNETCTRAVAMGRELALRYNLQYNVPDRCQLRHSAA